MIKYIYIHCFYSYIDEHVHKRDLFYNLNTIINNTIGEGSRANVCDCHNTMDQKIDNNFKKQEH